MMKTLYICAAFLCSCGPSILRPASSDAEIEAELNRSNIVLADGIERATAWPILKRQSDRYYENLAWQNDCENMSVERAEKQEACECGIVAACPKCAGGSYECSISSDRHSEDVQEYQRRMCADRDGHWVVYQVSSGSAFGVCSDGQWADQ